jgi:hypothetical protein
MSPWTAASGRSAAFTPYLPGCAAPRRANTGRAYAGMAPPPMSEEPVRAAEFVGNHGSRQDDDFIPATAPNVCSGSDVPAGPAARVTAASGMFGGAERRSSGGIGRAFVSFRCEVVLLVVFEVPVVWRGVQVGAEGK